MEFLQWIKRFWDANYSNTGYDAIKRRSGNGSAIVGSPVGAPIANSQKRSSVKPQVNPTNTHPVRNTLQSNNSNGNEIIAQFQAQVAELRSTLGETVKERDFYYGKLRQIENLVQKIEDPIITSGEFFKGVNEILYATEEGFEIPQ